MMDLFRRQNSQQTTDPRIDPRIDPRVDTRIDEALRLLATGQPPAGLESRIETRLHAARHAQAAAPGRSWTFAYAAMAILITAFGLAGAGAWHRSSSRPSAANQMPKTLEPAAFPTVPVAPSGLSTSAARRLPAQPVQSAGRARSQRHSGPGRASIARDAHRAPGVVTPAN